jgi:hypothetical protein
LFRPKGTKWRPLKDVFRVLHRHLAGDFTGWKPASHSLTGELEKPASFYPVFASLRKNPLLFDPVKGLFGPDKKRAVAGGR